MPDEEFIEGKLSCYVEYGQIEIPRENVILFNNTKESLASLVE
jgi:hypothetical protein